MQAVKTDAEPCEASEFLISGALKESVKLMVQSLHTSPCILVDVLSPILVELKNTVCLSCDNYAVFLPRSKLLLQLPRMQSSPKLSRMHYVSFSRANHGER